MPARLSGAPEDSATHANPAQRCVQSANNHPKVEVGLSRYPEAKHSPPTAELIGGEAEQATSPPSVPPSQALGPCSGANKDPGGTDVAPHKHALTYFSGASNARSLANPSTQFVQYQQTVTNLKHNASNPRSVNTR